MTAPAVITLPARLLVPLLEMAGTAIAATDPPMFCADCRRDNGPCPGHRAALEQAETWREIVHAACGDPAESGNWGRGGVNWGAA